MADRHYSRKTIGSRQFAPPGRKLVLYIPGPLWPFEVAAAWVWWHPHENAPIGRNGCRRADGYDGWYNCSLFRNESAPVLSSELIREAVDLVNKEWGLPPYGYDTYVWPEKLRSINPGYCYQKAGWLKDGWSKDGKKRRLYLPIEAGL